MSIGDFLFEAGRLKILIESTLPWDEKYDIGFNDMGSEIKASGVKIEWYDPDGDYQDDILAYYHAVMNKAEILSAAPDIVIGKSKQYVNYGMKVTLRNEFFGIESVLRNVTEIHYNHGQPRSDGIYIVFNSDIHGTGVNYRVENMIEYEAVLESEIADRF